MPDALPRLDGIDIQETVQASPETLSTSEAEQSTEIASKLNTVGDVEDREGSLKVPQLATANEAAPQKLSIQKPRTPIEDIDARVPQFLKLEEQRSAIGDVRNKEGSLKVRFLAITNEAVPKRISTQKTRTPIEYIEAQTPQILGLEKPRSAIEGVESKINK